MFNYLNWARLLFFSACMLSEIDLTELTAHLTE